MGALKKSGGYCVGSLRAFVRVNGERVNGGIEKGQWGHWSEPMQVLKRVSGGVGQGQFKWQWGRWSGSMGPLRGAGSGQKGARVVSSTLQGSKRYLTGVVSSTLQGCKLYLAGL